MANSSSILTAEQQAQLASFVRDVRSSVALKSQLNRIQANLDAAYNASGGASTLLGLLQATDVIDDGSGLAGIAPVTKQNVIDRIADAEADLGKYNNGVYLAIFAQFCGPENM